jgi:hypothetical protein
MTFRTWLEVAGASELRHTFEAFLPLDWTFIASHRGSGELKWRYTLSAGFSLELVVHPTSARGSGFTFQTNLHLVSSDLVDLESEASFSECLVGPIAALNPRGILVSIYVEGLARLLHGGSINLLVWERRIGLNEPDRWRALVGESLGIFGDLMVDIQSLPKKLLELDLLSSSGSPSPIVLFGNPFVLAAEVAVLLGDSHAAAQYVQSGRDQSWAQQGVASAEGFAQIAVCKGDKLAALGFQRKQPSNAR